MNTLPQNVVMASGLNVYGLQSIYNAKISHTWFPVFHLFSLPCHSTWRIATVILSSVL